MMDELEKIHAAITKIALHQSNRHVFLCTGPNCCTPEVGQAAWEILKARLKDAGLSTGPTACLRTKVGCLRICTGGPTMLVYPDGIWYRGMTAERIPQFVEEHLLGCEPIQDLVIAQHPLEG